jgi:hypothetical protein
MNVVCIATHDGIPCFIEGNQWHEDLQKREGLKPGVFAATIRSTFDHRKISKSEQTQTTVEQSKREGGS